MARKFRSPQEMRNEITCFRISKEELNTLYQYARTKEATMSYMIRAALEKVYPDIFKSINRHIRKPRVRKVRPMPEKTVIASTFDNVEGSTKILNGLNTQPMISVDQPKVDTVE